MRHMPTDLAALEAAVAQVTDPELERPLGELGMVRSVRSRWGRASVVVALPAPEWRSRQKVLDAVVAAGRGVTRNEVAVEAAVMDETERATLRAALRAVMAGDGPAGGVPAELADDGDARDAHVPGDEAHTHGHGHAHGEATGEPPAFLQTGSSTRVIGISSGKGGVGKSSVTVNVAVALAALGHRVGVLDADVYGFSVPKMLGAAQDPVVVGDVVIPTLVHGVRCLSMGYFVPDDQPVIWRGPLLHKAVQQFLFDAYWGQPDFLLIDMPPGTGDVTLSLSQVAPRTEVLVVTTPQPAAQRVAQRSAYAARKLKLAVRGVIENMSWFTGNDGLRYELFGAGGGALLAGDLGVPLLGQVPLVPALREGGDEGVPVSIRAPGSDASVAFAALAERVAAQGPARVYRRELTVR
jgi:ATP-binding protein involved in chromosome partitioning